MNTRGSNFATSQHTSNTTLSPLTYQSGQLAIQQTINSRNSNRPMIAATPIRIDLRRISVPNNTEKASTLADLITSLCTTYQIQRPLTDPNISSCTPIAVALTGEQKNHDSADRASVTATFLPVFQAAAHAKTSGTLIFSYIVSSNANLHIDNVQGLAQLNPSPKAITVIEKQESTEQQTNDCIVVFMKYSINSSEQNTLSSRSSSFRGNRDFSTPTTNQQSNKKTLTGIEIYYLRPVILTQQNSEMTLQPANDAIAMQLKKESTQLVDHCNYNYGDKVYTYSSFIKELNQYLAPKKINVTSSQILVHALLKLAGIDQRSTYFALQPRENAPQELYIGISIPPNNNDNLLNNIQQKLIEKYQASEPKFPPTSHQIRLNFSLSTLGQLIPNIKAAMDDMLKDPICLLAHQAYSANDETLSFEKVTQPIATLMKDHGIALIPDEESDSETHNGCLGTVLLHMFNITTEETEYAQLTERDGYVEWMMQCSLHIHLSAEIAHQLVNAINKEYSHLEKSDTYPLAHVATIYEASNRAGQKIPHCEIVIDKRILGDPKFTTTFKDSLDYLEKNQPRLMQAFRFQSKTQAKSTMQYAEDLRRIAKKFDTPATKENNCKEYNAKRKLAKALNFFANVIDDPQVITSDLEKISYKVHRRIAGIEGTQKDLQQHGLFRDTDKAEIKAVQNTLRLSTK